MKTVVKNLFKKIIVENLTKKGTTMVRKNVEGININTIFFAEESEIDENDSEESVEENDGGESEKEIDD